MSVLFVHGVGGRPRSWDPVLGLLDPALRRQAVAVDVTVAPGQSVADVADDVMRRHPGAHLVVGHSFGGMLAQEIALASEGGVDGLVLISTIPGATARVAAINRGLADDIEARGLEAFANPFAVSLFGPGRAEREPHLQTAFVADLIEAGATSVCSALRAIADWDATDRLPSLSCPVAVMTGDAEPDVDRQRLLARLVSARFGMLRDVGHLAPLEAPADVARAVADMATLVLNV